MTDMKKRISFLKIALAVMCLCLLVLTVSCAKGAEVEEIETGTPTEPAISDESEAVIEDIETLDLVADG